ncbi:hypothetical protein BDN70DRAFT_938925 [Pholiota conissans]|uniref:Uncharacterized protein n=1 Tax=Pholiota conissans TaxID=109636 RepID=A0A9P5YPT2_9AGAR|nr:hypothetical protein BDN70DRAFT_938925 [Pholiota conissans]
MCTAEPNASHLHYPMTLISPNAPQRTPRIEQFPPRPTKLRMVFPYVTGIDENNTLHYLSVTVTVSITVSISESSSSIRLETGVFYHHTPSMERARITYLWFRLSGPGLLRATPTDTGADMTMTMNTITNTNNDRNHNREYEHDHDHDHDHGHGHDHNHAHKPRSRPQPRP